MFGQFSALDALLLALQLPCHDWPESSFCREFSSMVEQTATATAETPEAGTGAGGRGRFYGKVWNLLADAGICAPLLLNRWRGNPNCFGYPRERRQDAPRRTRPSRTNSTPRSRHQTAAPTSEGRGTTSTNRPRARSWNRTQSGAQYRTSVFFTITGLGFFIRQCWGLRDFSFLFEL